MNRLNCLVILFIAFETIVHVFTTDDCGQFCDESWETNSTCWVYAGCNISFPGSEFECAGPPCNVKLNIVFTSFKGVERANNDVETEISLYDFTKNVTVIKYFQMYFKFISFDTSSSRSKKRYDFILDINRVSVKDSGVYNVTILDKYIGGIVLHHLFVMQVVQTSSNRPICDTQLLVHQGSHSSVGFLLTCLIRKDYHAAEIDILPNTSCFNVASSSSNASWKTETLLVPICERKDNFICLAKFLGKFNLPPRKNISESCTFDIERQLEILAEIQQTTIHGNNYVIDGISLALIFMMIAGCVAFYFYKKSRPKPLPLPVTRQETVAKPIVQNRPAEPVREPAVLRNNTIDLQDDELKKEALKYRQMIASDLYDDCGNGNQFYYDNDELNS